MDTEFTKSTIECKTERDNMNENFSNDKLHLQKKVSEELILNNPDKYVSSKTSSSPSCIQTHVSKMVDHKQSTAKDLLENVSHATGSTEFSRVTSCVQGNEAEEYVRECLTESVSVFSPAIEIDSLPGVCRSNESNIAIVGRYQKDKPFENRSGLLGSKLLDTINMVYDCASLDDGSNSPERHSSEYSFTGLLDCSQIVSDASFTIDVPLEKRPGPSKLLDTINMVYHCGSLDDGSNSPERHSSEYSFAGLLDCSQITSDAPLENHRDQSEDLDTMNVASDLESYAPDSCDIDGHSSEYTFENSSERYNESAVSGSESLEDNSTDCEGNASDVSFESYKNLPGISGVGRIIEVISEDLTYEGAVALFNTNSSSDSFDRIIRRRESRPDESLSNHPDYLSESLIVTNDQLMKSALPEECDLEMDMVPERSKSATSFASSDSKGSSSKFIMEEGDYMTSSNEEFDSKESEERKDSLGNSADSPLFQRFPTNPPETDSNVYISPAMKHFSIQLSSDNTNAIHSNVAFHSEALGSMNQFSSTSLLTDVTNLSQVIRSSNLPNNNSTNVIPQRNRDIGYLQAFMNMHSAPLQSRLSAIDLFLSRFQSLRNSNETIVGLGKSNNRWDHNYFQSEAVVPTMQVPSTSHTITSAELSRISGNDIWTGNDCFLSKAVVPTQSYMSTSRVTSVPGLSPTETNVRYSHPTYATHERSSSETRNPHSSALIPTHRTPPTCSMHLHEFQSTQPIPFASHVGTNQGPDEQTVIDISSEYESVLVKYKSTLRDYYHEKQNIQEKGSDMCDFVKTNIFNVDGPSFEDTYSINLDELRHQVCSLSDDILSSMNNIRGIVIQCEKAMKYLKSYFSNRIMKSLSVELLGHIRFNVRDVNFKLDKIGLLISKNKYKIENYHLIRKLILTWFSFN